MLPGVRERLEPIGQKQATPASAGDTVTLAELLVELEQVSNDASVSRLAAHLERMTAGPTGDDARALVEALEKGRFAELTAGERKLRQLAVEALLRMGYPWALQITPADLEWYRARARAKSPAWRFLRITLAVLIALAAVLGVGFLGVGAEVRLPHFPVEATAPAPPASRVDVYRTEDGARLAELSVKVPPRVSPGAAVELGAVRALSSAPALDVLHFPGQGIATIVSSPNGERTLSILVPLTPERFDPNKRYFFEADLLVDGQPSGTATTPEFEVAAPPLRRAGERRAAEWTMTAEEPPALRAPARLLLGIDSRGKLLWSQFLQAGMEDRLAIEAYLRQLKGSVRPMFQRRPLASGPQTGGIIDWEVGPERVRKGEAPSTR